MTITDYDFDDYIQPEPVLLTFTSNNLMDDDAPQDPSAAVVLIQPGYDPADLVTLNVLTDFTEVSTGVYQYQYQTADVDASAGPVECVAQASATGTLVGASKPYYFRVLPQTVSA